jgi:hypothetical protein
MSLVTGTARTGEAAAVAEAPLFDGTPLILGTIAINVFYVGVRIYVVSQPLVVFSQASAVMMTMLAQMTPATIRLVVFTP